MTANAAPDLTRRMLTLGGLALAGCQRKDTHRAADAKGPTTLAAAVAGGWRSPQDKARDRFRHPLESLTFWGLSPGARVVEFWPGTGWYTDILAPFLKATGGTLIAATLETGHGADPSALSSLAAYREHLAARRALFGEVGLVEFGPHSGPVASAGTIDLVLFLRNIHNWMAAGIAEKAFADAWAALRPGGVLGVEEHRAKPGSIPDPMASSGYVLQAYVAQMALEAGFVQANASEINANPRDTRDHPFGVWTLPPTRLSAPRGQPAKPGFDHRPYDAIGESDRMTLRFVKPG